MWREARGESLEGMTAVGCVVRNRATSLPWDKVICAKWQFSSMTATGDSQLVVWPGQDDPTWQSAMSLAEEIYNGTTPDNTGGATHYFNPSVVLPSWAERLEYIKSIGRHDFYK